jgi:hypothetical protein
MNLQSLNKQKPCYIIITHTFLGKKTLIQQKNDWNNDFWK